MSVGYRSFLTVDGGPCVETVIEHMDRWSRAKEIDIHAGAPGRYVLDPDDVITIARQDEGDRKIYRWRRLHPFARGVNEIWRTTITALESADSTAWLWTEIEVADDDDGDLPARVPFMSVPTVLRELLADLPCRDGLVPSSTAPVWVAPADLPDLMDYLADETRLGPVYVARQGTRDVDGFHAWATDVMWEVVGLGNAFLLSGQAEHDFNDMVGEHHAIPEEAIRTYLPGVDLDDPHDPRRHQILGSVRIERSGPRRLAYIFGLSQRDRGTLAPLPAEAWQIESMLSAGESAVEAGAVNVDLRVAGRIAADGPSAGPTPANSPNGLTPNGLVRNGGTPTSISPVRNGVSPNGGGPGASIVLADGREQTGEPAGVLSRRGQHRRMVELLEENDRLRAEVEELRAALGDHQHTDVAVRAALEALEEEVNALRCRLGLDSPGVTRRQLSAS